MERIKLTTNLFLDEYIPRQLYEQYKGREGELIKLLDKRLIEADQKLRDLFGPVMINNWWSGGPRNWSGLRTPESPYYSPTSQHTHGRASDKIFSRHSAKEVQEYIRNNYQELGITGLELSVTWVHSDVRESRNNKLITFTS